MALFAAMTAQITKSNHGRTVILSVILLAVIASGIPQVKIHTHEDANLGHGHDAGVHNNDHDSENEFPNDVDGLADSGTAHAHDLGASAVTLVNMANLNVVVHWHRCGGIPPPTARPPDNLISPHYRPPIV